MSGIIYLIVAIIFVARLMSAVNKAKDQKTYGNYTNKSTSTYQSTNQSYGSRADVSGAPIEPVVRSSVSVATARTTNQSTAAKSAPNTYVSKKNADSTANSSKKTSNVSTVHSEKKKSTTEILNEKAMEDQKQHYQEKMDHDREERRIHGKLRYAGRHYPGDPIPNGMREVICDYCNAENLVPVHDFSTKYNCYFCREVL